MTYCLRPPPPDRLKPGCVRRSRLNGTGRIHELASPRSVHARLRFPHSLAAQPMNNLKLAARMLLKTPFVTAIAVLSLALGIGANSAIFSLFDQILLRRSRSRRRRSLSTSARLAQSLA